MPMTRETDSCPLLAPHPLTRSEKKEKNINKMTMKMDKNTNMMKMKMALKIGTKYK